MALAPTRTVGTEFSGNIRKLKNPWRDKWQQALFRDAMFFVETDARTGGRRVAVHQYPKRNIPYAEDMGRAANKYIVQGYLIGPNYLGLKDNLILALEKDGPGWLRLPLPFQMSDQYVMVMSYTVTEAREKGGFCAIEMEFVEYGDPAYREVISTADEINKSATATEDNIIGPKLDTIGPKLEAAAPYAQIYQGSGIDDFNVNIGDIQINQ